MLRLSSRLPHAHAHKQTNLESRHSGKRAIECLIHAEVADVVKDVDELEAVALAGQKVIGVVRRRHLRRPASGRQVHEGVRQWWGFCAGAGTSIGGMCVCTGFEVQGFCGF
eukprot:81527-Chlamydomonas_euryale.AAC.1